MTRHPGCKKLQVNCRDMLLPASIDHKPHLITLARRFRGSFFPLYFKAPLVEARMVKPAQRDEIIQ